MLDRQGLIALWRETLLAQAVLFDETVGYRNHPQLRRFQETAEPKRTIGAYLVEVANEATARGYRFNREKIRYSEPVGLIEVTDGQLAYEAAWLREKIAVRSPEWLAKVASQLTQTAPHHGLFTVVPGPIADWEIVKPLS